MTADVHSFWCDCYGNGMRHPGASCVAELETVINNLRGAYNDARSFVVSHDETKDNPFVVIIDRALSDVITRFTLDLSIMLGIGPYVEEMPGINPSIRYGAGAAEVSDDGGISAL